MSMAQFAPSTDGLLARLATGIICGDRFHPEKTWAARPHCHAIKTRPRLKARTSRRAARVLLDDQTRRGATVWGREFGTRPLFLMKRASPSCVCVCHPEKILTRILIDVQVLVLFSSQILYTPLRYKQSSIRAATNII